EAASGPDGLVGDKRRCHPLLAVPTRTRGSCAPACPPTYWAQHFTFKKCEAPHPTPPPQPRRSRLSAYPFLKFSREALAPGYSTRVRHVPHPLAQIAEVILRVRFKLQRMRRVRILNHRPLRAGRA